MLNAKQRVGGAGKDMEALCTTRRCYSIFDVTHSNPPCVAVRDIESGGGVAMVVQNSLEFSLGEMFCFGVSSAIKCRAWP